MKKDAKKLIFLVLASIMLHLGAFYTIATFSDFIFYNELKRLLDHKIVDKTKDLSTQIELVDLDKKQVVDQSKNSINDEAPKDSKFLSVNDQTVKKETKAQNNGAFQNSKQRPAQMSVTASKAMISAEALLIKPAHQTKSAPVKKDFGLQGLKSSLNQNTIAQRRMKFLKTLASQESESAMKPVGPSQTDDDLEGIEDGEFTLLNTRRTKYFSFYSRIKGQLRSHWNPLIREEVSFIYATKRSPAAIGKKRTSVQITLDKDGYLEEIALLKTSGNKAIDTAAIQALRLAAPFPNPPKGMRGKDKKIRIFWDFVLET
ncbi:MAG: energy transducer TonB [Bdellovibrionales bacterium]